MPPPGAVPRQPRIAVDRVERVPPQLVVVHGRRQLLDLVDHLVHLWRALHRALGRFLEVGRVGVSHQRDRALVVAERQEVEHAVIGKTQQLLADLFDRRSRLGPSRHGGQQQDERAEGTTNRCRDISLLPMNWPRVHRASPQRKATDVPRAPARRAPNPRRSGALRPCVAIENSHLREESRPMNPPCAAVPADGAGTIVAPTKLKGNGGRRPLHMHTSASRLTRLHPRDGGRALRPRSLSICRRYWSPMSPRTCRSRRTSARGCSTAGRSSSSSPATSARRCRSLARSGSTRHPVTTCAWSRTSSSSNAAGRFASRKESAARPDWRTSTRSRCRIKTSARCAPAALATAASS